MAVITHTHTHTHTHTGDSFNFFEDLKLVVQMGQPLCDAIHQLEADKPLLSQLLPIFESLVRGTADWVEALQEVRSKQC